MTHGDAPCTGIGGIHVKFCSGCGERNNDTEEFCVSCGHFLGWSDSQSSPAIPEPTDEPRPALPSKLRAAPPATPELQIAATLDGGRALAMARNRDDIAARLGEVGKRLEHSDVLVAVVGEFKSGKSTLVNALLQTSVCPQDADEVTVVPTLVTFGDPALALAHLQASDGAAAIAESIPLESIAEYVSESGNPDNRRRLTSVEVRLKHRMLQTGLSLVDTPGVGGLDSAHGVVSLTTLDAAQGMLFVTDASQELTAPELEFLQQALQRCPLAACVLTKTDLYREWRRIAEINEAHLRRAGLDLPVIPVSSFLRLRARTHPELLQESGFEVLAEFLATSVVKSVRLAAAKSAAADVGFAAEQIGREIAAERSVLVEPAKAGQVMAALTAARKATGALVAPTATWQQSLADGVQDLVSDIEHDLQERLRNVLRDAEGIIEKGDPKDSWTDLEGWLRRQVAGAAVANYDLMALQAQEVAEAVAEMFQLDLQEPLLMTTIAPHQSLSALSMTSRDKLQAPGGRFGSMLMATRMAMFVPMALFGLAGGLLGVAIAAPVTAALAAGIGQKIIRDEKKRQLAYRRQQARLAARGYVEEVSFVMNKQTRDALRRTQRQLRDEFQMRAALMHQSSVRAVTAAGRALQMSPPDRQARTRELGTQSEALRRLDRDLQAVTGQSVAV